jgi:RNA polymerase sigma-70 factor (ECF subfamily)
VAHNAAASHVIRERRRRSRELVSIEELESAPDPLAPEAAAGERQALDRLMALVHRLKPLDRQVILSYLEGLDAAAISEITGISSGNVAVKIHRIKQVLAKQFHEGAKHAE